MGNGFGFHASFDILAEYSTKTSGAVHTYYDYRPQSTQGDYSYISPASVEGLTGTFALNLVMTQFNQLNGSSIRDFTIYIEKLGLDDGLSLTEINGVYFAQEPNPQTIEDLDLSSTSRDCLVKTKSTFNL